MDIDLAFRAAEQAIRKAQKILLVTHSRPDGDAVGSTSAMALHLAGLGKAVAVFCLDAVPERYAFAPGSERFSADKNLFQKDWDLLIALDCGALANTEALEEINALGHGVTKISFDHHPSHRLFANVNVVDVASSACEIVHRYLRATGAPISQDIATALLMGIYFDTATFSNALTGRAALASAADLMRCGADANLVVARVFKNESLEYLRVLGAVLSRLKHHESLGITSTAIFLDDMANVSPEVSQRVSDVLSGLMSMSVLMVLKERPEGAVRCSFRSTDQGDMLALAKRLGGGGHVGAGGFTLPGRIVEGENGWRVEKV
ncbi:MAG: DHH family phosphoesterase [Patescibacteria group bacterium]|nr:DHH family phosphoesterase [Patescibacteria group bacterium]